MRKRSLRERYCPNPNWPSSYRQPHPDFPINPWCQACELHRCDQDPPVAALASNLPDELEKVRLVVISDYPGPYEAELGHLFVDNRLIAGLEEAPRNAGSMIRYLLSDMFALDPYQEVFWTNALRCQRKSGEITPNQLRTCVRLWTKADFERIDQVLPEVPVLVAGKYAFHSLSLLDPDRWKETGDLHAYRRGVHRLRNHPLVVTINPAAVGRAVPRLETGWRKEGKRQVPVLWEMPLMVGSAEWHARRDLEYLRPYLYATRS